MIHRHSFTQSSQLLYAVGRAKHPHPFPSHSAQSPPPTHLIQRIPGTDHHPGWTKNHSQEYLTRELGSVVDGKEREKSWSKSS